MSDDAVLYDSDGHIATITLNRPDNRNSMTPDVLAGFMRSIRRARDERSLRAVVITGSGSSFCAGADFRAGLSAAGTEYEGRLPHERSFGMYEPFLAVLDIQVPVIGALNGHAIGGGLGLALVCDIRVANRDAKYGANFARLGLHSGMAISYLLPRIVGMPIAADLLFSGRLITGTEAAELHLAHCAVPPAEVLPEARRRAQAVAACAPIAIRLLKKSLYRGAEWDPRKAAEAEAWAQSATLQTEDAQEGMRALLEKREPDFKGR
jgi:enoyl-CoA hydratase/carnithine racemase